MKESVESVKMSRILYNIMLATFVALFIGCDSLPVMDTAVDMSPVEQLGSGEVEHTLVMYLLANNNLETSIYHNALDAEAGMVGALPSTRLVIYLDRRNETKLYEVRYLPYGDGDEYIRYCKVLKTYPDQISTKPEVMRGVLEDVKRLAPSKSYGLVCSGHGTGWFPKPSSGTSYDKQKVAPLWGEGEYVFNYDRYVPETKAMGYDLVELEDGSLVRTDESFISSAEIVEGLSPIHFDYILFDACFMSSVEFLYDLRHSTDYVIASPVEVLGVGMPYKEVVRNLMTTNHNLATLCDIIMDVYMRDDKFTATKSLALALIDCSHLEALADAVADVYDSVSKGDYKSTLKDRIKLSEIQMLDRMIPAAFHDMDDYVYAMAGGNTPQMQHFLEVLDKVVVKSVHTEDIYSYGYSSDGFAVGYANIEYKVNGVMDLCGISTYVPSRDLPVTLEYYFQTEWAKKVYSEE